MGGSFVFILESRTWYGTSTVFHDYCAVRVRVPGTRFRSSQLCFIHIKYTRAGSFYMVSSHVPVHTLWIWRGAYLYDTVVDFCQDRKRAPAQETKKSGFICSYKYGGTVLQLNMTRDVYWPVAFPRCHRTSQLYITPPHSSKVRTPVGHSLREPIAMLQCVAWMHFCVSWFSHQKKIS